MASPDIVIVGGGINGCAAAYELARGGHRVTVVERYAPAAMASGWTLAGVRQSGRHPAELPLAPGGLGYVFVARGQIEANGQRLEAGDALTLRDEGAVRLRAGQGAEVLVFDLAP